MKPILKSLRSLSLAAQIDVRPCFTFNSIGQKTAIRWRDAASTAFPMSVHCADDSPRRLDRRSLWRDATDLPSFHSCGPPALGARGKGRSLELSTRPLTRNCHYLSHAGERSPRNDRSPEVLFLSRLSIQPTVIHNTHLRGEVFKRQLPLSVLS